MSVRFQCLVVRDAAPTMELSEKGLEWLVCRQIVQRTPSHCVLDGNAKGHRPGPSFMAATDEEENPNVSNMNFDDMQRGITGMQVILGKHISVSDALLEPLCNKCKRAHSVDGDWNRAAQAWWDGNGSDSLRREHCGHAESISDWNHQGSIGFGTLTFQFWNWPQLSQQFIRAFERELGQDVCVVWG